MSRSTPYSVFFRGRRYAVTSLHDARVLTEILSREIADNRLGEVRDLIERAASGYLAPRVALTALEHYVQQVGIYKQVPKSAAACGFPSCVRNVHI